MTASVQIDGVEALEPTAQQCTDRERVGPGVACWYPQMGGYVAKALVVADGCLDVYVWHDGDFPFTGEDSHDGLPAPSPAHLHHCDGQQFVDFGQLLLEIAGPQREE